MKREFKEVNKSMYFPQIPGLNDDPSKYRGVFSNQSVDHNSLRTNSVEGEFTSLPKIGRPFNIIGESLTLGGSMRLITTSLVTKIDQHLPGQAIVFQTENSRYRLDYSEIEEA